MNNFIKQVIEEKFASKAQQRFFYAKANEKGAPKKEKKKWSKWAKEFSDKTDFNKIPDKKDEVKDPNQTEMEFDEIVDDKGDIAQGKKPTDLHSKTVTSDSDTDTVVRTGRGQMGNYGVKIANYIRYAIEEGNLTKEKIMEIAMKDALGYDETLGSDKDYDEAEEYFEKDLELSPEETKDRMEKMGYDEDLPDDMVRLVENPRKFMEEYIEDVLSKRKVDNDIVSKGGEIEEKEINPIILKQLKSLKSTLSSHKLSVDDIMKHLKDNE